MNTLLPWAVAAGLQVARDVRVYRRPPVPSEFVASGLVFGALTALGQAEPQLAGVLAWGFLAALVIRAAPGGGITKRRVPVQERKGG